MSLAGEVVQWLSDGTHWQGDFGIPTRLREHVALSGTSFGVALVVSFPVAVWLGHHRRGGVVAVNVANVGRAVPSLAILLLAVQWLGLKEWPIVGSVTALIALSLLALAPILTNTFIGVRDVDDELRQSAKAMGMTGWQQVRHVELPLAMPLALAGMRSAAVQVVATATLAAPVGGGGLGRFIVDGLAVRSFDEVVGGALLVGALSVVVDSLFGTAGRILLRRPVG